MSVTYCANHPDKETTLRCNRCNKPICAKCAVRTPTGYRCKECINQLRKKFDTAIPMDFIVAFVIAAVLSFFGSMVTSFIGIFIIFLSPAIGVLIAEMVRRAVGKRRSRALFVTATVGVVVGGLATSLPVLLSLLINPYPMALMGLVWPGVYVFFAATTTYVRLSGIQIR
jgi:MFS family permease